MGRYVAWGSSLQCRYFLLCAITLSITVFPVWFTVEDYPDESVVVIKRNWYYTPL
jgi:hypothetical protein